MKNRITFLPSILLSLSILPSILCAQSQSLYMPRNIQQAYANGTRSYDGRPGKNYWQNAGKYDIALTVHPQEHYIQGQETIEYHNNSSEALTSLVLRFVNNIHKPGAARAGMAWPDFITSGLKIEKCVIGQDVYEVNNTDFSTVYNIKLHQPLASKSKVILQISWQYPLSKQSGREGMLDSTTVYAAYSYPRVSVYDDYNGWDRLEHSDRAEFYNDFNDYKVAVTAPANYIVWGTGDLQNPEQVLQPKFVQRLKASYVSDSVIHIASLSELAAHEVTLQQPWLTWRFESTHISDVCFAVGDHYVWDASSIVVDSAVMRRVSMQAAYNDTAVDFHHAVKWGKYALDKFSRHWPGVPYPYTKMTAVQGQADMEYPMMVNDATVGSNFRFAQMLQDHEMAHTYFPFYMGINETRYAFMDEGWATTFEYLIGIEEYGQADADSVFKMFRVQYYTHSKTTEQDQPMIMMSSQQSGMGYGMNSYGKAAMCYLSLKSLLGDEMFKKALHFYMQTWNGKHPIPWDFFHCINTAAGRDLNWFFNNWFFTNNYVDLAIKETKKVKGKYYITIENKGGFVIPFTLKLTDSGHQLQPKELKYSTAVWQKNEKSVTLELPDNYKNITLDNGIFMDSNDADNHTTL